MRLTILPLVLAICAACGPTDIRPEQLKAGQTAIPPHGVSLLRASIEAHGGWERWRSHQTLKVVMTDHWDGIIGWFSMPWPENGQRMEMQFLRGTFYGKTKMLGGPSDGDTWGVQAWKAYLTSANGGTEFRDHDDTLFLVPTYQYFLEFPYRIGGAGIIQFAGTRAIGENEYELVYATWGTEAPQLETDQYVLWIGAESRLIEKIEFTVRDQMRWATGTMHFSDYRDVEGIQIPFDMTVTLGPEDESHIHRMQLESVEFDTVPKTVFFPDPSLPFTADSKVTDYRY